MRSLGKLYGVEVVALDLRDEVPEEATVIPANSVVNLGALQEEILRARTQNRPVAMIALVGVQPEQLKRDLDEICSRWVQEPL